MFDASDEVYEYLLGAVCPVNLSKAGLSYDAENNRFGSRVRDWLVELPLAGFLFPAFQDRSTDLHSMLYYSKNPEELREGFVQGLFGCGTPLSAGDQKETFNAMIEETLGEDCDYEAVRNIHEKLQELVEDAIYQLCENLSLGREEIGGKTFLFLQQQHLCESYIAARMKAMPIRPLTPMLMSTETPSTNRKISASAMEAVANSKMISTTGMAHSTTSSTSSALHTDGRLVLAFSTISSAMSRLALLST